MSNNVYLIDKKSRGYTFIELLLYIALISIFMTGTISFTWNNILNQQKSIQEQVVTESARIAMKKIGYEIRNAQNIQSLSANQLILDDGGGNTTLIRLSSGTILISTNGGASYNLTSNQVTVLAPPFVSDPLFTNLSSFNNNGKNIKVALTVQTVQMGTSQQFSTTTSLSESFELKGLFNQARSLLIDASGAQLSGGTQISTISLKDVGQATDTLDKILVSWSGGAGGSSLRSIVINGTSVWSGTASSGTTVDITDVPINPTSAIPVNGLYFTNNMTGTSVIITYTMIDGSSRSSEISF